MRTWFLAALAGCGGSPTGALVADVTENLTLAVVGEAGAREAYLCGQETRLVDSQWFVEQGGVMVSSVEGSPLTLELDDVGFVVSEGTSVWSGPLELDGALFDASPDGCRVGAIAIDDRLIGTWCDGATAYAQVEPVGTFAPRDDLIEVEAFTPTGAKTFEVERVP